MVYFTLNSDAFHSMETLQCVLAKMHQIASNCIRTPSLGGDTPPLPRSALGASTRSLDSPPDSFILPPETNGWIKPCLQVPGRIVLKAVMHHRHELELTGESSEGFYDDALCKPTN